MRKKVIGLTIAGIVALSGVVSAASLWGTYKGNDIVQLTVNGAPVKVSDVPAISYNNRTMVPIYLLQQAGVNYSWDAANKTVQITKPDPVDTQAIRDVPISWLKLYASTCDVYMRWSRLSLQITHLDAEIFTAMDYSINGDPTQSLANANDELNWVHDQYNSIEKLSKQILIDLQTNNLSNELDVISNSYSKAIDHYDAALLAVNKYKISKSNADFASYQAEMQAGNNLIVQTDKTTNTEYQTYFNDIQNFQ